MIKNIIFDIGNVLVDFHPQKVLEQMGFCREHIEAILDATVRSKAWVELDRGVIPEEEVIADMRKKVPQDVQAEFDRFFAEGRPDLVEVYPYVHEWIHHFRERGYKIYLLSNYPVSFFELHSSSFTFLPLADGRVVSGYVRMIKPDAEIYYHLLEKYQLQAEECIFIDDNAANIEAANALGIHGVQFLNYEDASRKVEAILRAQSPETEEKE